MHVFTATDLFDYLVNFGPEDVSRIVNGTKFPNQNAGTEGSPAGTLHTTVYSAYRFGKMMMTLTLSESTLLVYGLILIMFYTFVAFYFSTGMHKI